MLKVYSVLIFICISAQVFAGGGWTQGKGNSFFLLSQRYIGGSFYANNQGQILNLHNDRAGVFTTHFYSEYGVLENLDFIFHAQLFTASYYTDEIPSTYLPYTPPKSRTSNMGFGDIDFAAKYKFYDNGINLSATLLLGLPTGRHKPHIFGNTEALTSDGDFNQMLKIEASSGLGKNYFYTAFLGLNNRTNGFSDEIHVGGEIGRNGNKLISILKVYLLKSFENGNNFPAGIPGIYSNNLEYLAISPCFLYKFNEKNGLIFEAGFAPYLRNIIAAPSFSIGYWFKPSIKLPSTFKF